jgi:hypothetical protein
MSDRIEPMSKEYGCDLDKLVQRILGQETFRQLIKRRSSDPNANLVEWQLSGEPDKWVQEHFAGWDRFDWLDLLASLRASRYWPLDEAAVGQHLEKLRDESRVERANRLELEAARRTLFDTLLPPGESGPVSRFGGKSVRRP